MRQVGELAMSEKDQRGSEQYVGRSYEEDEATQYLVKGSESWTAGIGIGFTAGAGWLVSEESLRVQSEAYSDLMVRMLLYHEKRMTWYDERLDLLTSVVGNLARLNEFRTPDDDSPASPRDVREGAAVATAAAQQLTAELTESFDDLELRLALTIELKSKTREIWLLARDEGKRFLKQIAMILHDAVAQVYSERMVPSQVDAMGKVLTLMSKEVLDMTDARHALDTLVSADLEGIPIPDAEEAAVVE